MKILVTGATGFVAGHLIPHLVARGHSVVAGVHRPDERHGSDVDVVQLDLSDAVPPDAARGMDAIVHLAQANVPFPDAARELFRVNAASTQELLDAARDAGATRFVLASSGSVYGPGDGVVGEDDPRRASDFYAVTKRSAELLVEAYAPYLATSILRLFAPYGPAQSGRLVPSLIGRVRDGRPVKLNAGGRPRLTPVYVADVVRTIDAALERDSHDTVNVAGDEPASIRELALLIGDVIGVEPIFVEGDGDAPGDFLGSNARMRELYGLDALVPLREGLRQTVVDPVAA